MLREVNQSAAADVRFGLGRVVTALAFTWIILSMVQGLASFSLKGSWSFFFFRIFFFSPTCPIGIDVRPVYAASLSLFYTGRVYVDKIWE